MGDLSVHVAKIARMRVPDVAVPAEIKPTVSRMADVARDHAAQSGDRVALRIAPHQWMPNHAHA